MIRVDGTGRSQFDSSPRLDKTYRRGGEEIQVCSGLNLDVDKGDFVGFMGPSGSGKTTLLNLLGRPGRPHARQYHVAGDEITHMSAQAHAMARPPCRLIFQMYNLIPVLNRLSNVELPCCSQNSQVRAPQARETALGDVGLAERMNHYGPALGGQEQRVAIAAPSSPTHFLLCDEPPATSTAKSADEIHGADPSPGEGTR